MENTVNTEITPAPETSAPTAPARKRGGSKRASKKAAVKTSRIVTATLEQRQVRVVFKQGSKVVHTSPTYKSRNILSKIVAFARSTSGGKASGATPVAQVTTDGKKWVTVTE